MPFAPANGVRTFYRSVGEGPPLLLIAGNGMEHTTFDEQLPAFSAQFRCIVYDTRGIGQSDVPSSGYTPKVMAQDALDLLTALGVERAHVAGYSLGGAIAQEMVLAAPGRVRSLSLYSSYEKPTPYMRLRYEILIKVVRETTPELWAMYSAFSAFGPGFVNAHEAELREEISKRTARWASGNGPSRVGLAGHYEAILAHDTSTRLGDIACPTWIAVGSADVVTPPPHSMRLHEGIRDSSIEIFDGKPHRILNFDAATFTAAALAFLKRHRNA